MIRVLIGDDHAVVRMGLKSIVDKQTDMKVLGEASNAWEILELCRKEPWDVVVLDITMPRKSGLEALQELKKEWPEKPVLVLSVHSEDLYAVRAIRAGAAGYLSKDFAPEELVSAIRKVVQGGKYISSSLAEKLAQELDVSNRGDKHAQLSNREFQVMRFIASGKTIREISQDLILSSKTVETFRARIMAKMKFRNNAELIRYVLENNLLS